MAMTKIEMGKVKSIADEKKLRPGKVIGTAGVQFTKGDNKRLEVISWGDFETALDMRGLAVYESKGWMKIMKK